MAIEILSVARGSIAAKAGIQPGETLLRINGEDVLDEIDYQALSDRRHLILELSSPEGMVRTLSLHKPAHAALGLRLDERTILEPRSCKNHCIFCFVDQMPPHMRPSLYVKDDDWRLSLMMGNFVTLTNVDDAEFDRILRRKASPLYISVQATDPDVRVRMLKNPNAGLLMPRLRRMADAGLKFHCQVVLCPGINDGPVLHQTIVDLASLYPAAQSLALVPIGLTGHREHLTPLRLYERDEARAMLRDWELIQDYYLREKGTRFLFPADEFYSIAGLPVPPEEAYEGYPQIENGIGMLRQLAEECREAQPRLRDEMAGMISPPPAFSGRTLIPTGVSALPYIQELVRTYAPAPEMVDVFAVPNRFFGPSVTVTGLITGGDLAESLRQHEGERALISCSMLRENGDVFLDDLSVPDVERMTGLPLRVVRNRGMDFLKALYGYPEKGDSDG